MIRRRFFSLIALGVSSALLLFAGLVDGSKTVASAGQAVALSATSVRCAWVVVQAKPGNTGSIFIGASTIADGRGTELDPGDSQPFPLIPQDRWHWYDLAEIYVDSAVNGEGVTFTYFTR